MNEPRQFHDDHLDALRAMLDAIANGVGLTTGQIPAPTRALTAMEVLAVQSVERGRWHAAERSRQRIRAVFNGLPPYSDQYLPTVFEPQLPPHPSWETATDLVQYRPSREAAEYMAHRAGIEAAKVYVPDPFAAREPWWPDFKHTEFAQKAMRDKARKLVEQFKGNGGRDGCAALNRVEQTEEWNKSLPDELVEHCPAPRQITHNDPDRVRLRAQLIE